MGPAGYWLRVFDGFVADSKYDALREDLTPAHAVHARLELAAHFLPAPLSRLAVARINEDSLARAYHCYKGKCIGACGGLVCTMAHAHARDAPVLTPEIHAWRLASPERSNRSEPLVTSQRREPSELSIVSTSCQ